MIYLLITLISQSITLTAASAVSQESLGNIEKSTHCFRVPPLSKEMLTAETLEIPIKPQKCHPCRDESFNRKMRFMVQRPQVPALYSSEKLLQKTLTQQESFQGLTPSNLDAIYMKEESDAREYVRRGTRALAHGAQAVRDLWIKMTNLIATHNYDSSSKLLTVEQYLTPIWPQ